MKKSSHNLSSNTYEHIFNHAPFGMMVFKSVLRKDMGNYVFALESYNPKADEFLGISKIKKEELFLNTIIPDPSSTDIYNECLSVIENGKPQERLIRLNTKRQPDIFKIHISKTQTGIALLLFDQETESFDNSTNIDDEIKYSKLFDTSLDAIFLAVDNFNIISVNPKFCELFKFNETAITPLLLEDLFRDPDKYEQFVQLLEQRQFVEEFEAALLTSKKETKYCLINSVAVIDENNKLLMYQGVIRDITKKRETEQQLITAEKLTLTGRLARSIAHEVRNPLTNIRLAVDQFKEELPDDLEDSDFYLELIGRNVDRISNLITDLMNSSKKKTLELKPWQLNDIVSETITLVRDRLELREINLKTSLSDELPVVQLDKKQVKIALINILLNAIEAMEETQGVLQIYTFMKEDHVCVSVTDNGKGIPQEELHHLFEPFYTGKKTGSGLGLTATRNIIHAHHGSITVESQEAKGSTFTISFSTRVDTEEIKSNSLPI